MPADADGWGLIDQLGAWDISPPCVLLAAPSLHFQIVPKNGNYISTQAVPLVQLQGAVDLPVVAAPLCPPQDYCPRTCPPPTWTRCWRGGDTTLHLPLPPDVLGSVYPQLGPMGKVVILHLPLPPDVPGVGLH